MVNEKLFEFAAHTVLSEGGDGDMTIECRLSNFEEMCREFLEWHKTSIIKHWQVEKTEEYLGCWDNQESITIFDKGLGSQHGWTFRVIL